MKIKKKRWFVIIVFCVALAGIGTGVYLQKQVKAPDKGQTDEIINVNVGEDGIALQSETEQEVQKTADANKKDKAETVNVKAAADGTVKDITVDTILKNAADGEEIRDVSMLQEVKNTKGDEEYTEENGMLIWQNHGESIEYEGKSTRPLPVNVSISYFLNGQKVEPQELAGKSGSVRIRFDYTNNTAETVEVGEKQVEVKVPFTVVSTMVLPEDVFTNVKVENGKLISMGDENMMVGIAFPGMEECLHLKDYEVTEDIELPDYVEMTADVTEFELSFTATVISPGLFEDFDTGDLDEIEDLPDSMRELNDASKELVDAAGELVDGSASLRTYLGTYTAGVASVDEGTRALLSGVSKLNQNKSALEEGAEALESGLKQMDNALKQVSVSDTTQKSPDDGTKALEAAMKALAADAQTLGTSLTAMNESLTKIETFIKDACQYQANVAQTAGEVQALLSETGAGDGKGQVTAAVNEAARTQALEAASAALQNTELSEEEKQRIAGQIANSIDLTAAAGTAWDSSQTSVQQTIAAALGKLENMPVLNIPTVTLDTSGIQASLQDMQKQLKVISSFAEEISGMQEGVKEVTAMVKQVRTAVAELAKGSSQLTKGIGTYNQGIQQVYDGVEKLSGGTLKLAEAGDDILAGADALKEGMEAYRDGVKLFDEDGIQKLTELGDESLLDVTTGIRALKEADSRYNNYGGIADGMTGSVVFLVETEEIKKE